jgi:hypothetical protein
MKGRAEKVGEVVKLLKKLIEAGIPTTDSGYFQTKALMDSWIAGDKDLVDEKIEFMRYGRVGHLSMFNQDGKNPIFVLKATEALKEQVEG